MPDRRRVTWIHYAIIALFFALALLFSRPSIPAPESGEPAAGLLIGLLRGRRGRARRAEEAIRDSEERYRRLIESTNVIAWESDVATGRFTYVSPQAVRLLGYPAEAWYEENFWPEHIHPEDRDYALNYCLEASARHEHYEFEYRMLARDGRVVWLRDIVSVMSEGGVPKALRGFMIDITDRKQAEAEREQLLEREQAARKEAQQAQAFSAELLVREAAARAQAEQALRLQHEMEDRFMLLTEASAALLSSLNVERVLSAILELAGRLTAADAQAIWRFDRETKRWQAVTAYGLPEAYQAEWIEMASDKPALPERPIVAEDIEREPVLAGRLDMLRREGVRSLLVVPLKICGDDSGTITFYYRKPYRFAETDVRLAVALGNLAASAITTAELYEEQSRQREAAQQAHVRAAFLSEASATLGTSLDYETTLKNVAGLAVPHFADWCVVDLMGDDRQVRRLVVAHADPSREELLREAQERYPPDYNAPHGVAKVLRTGQSELYAEITDAQIEAGARDAEHLRLLRQFRLKSGMCVPLRAGGRTLGAMTFLSSEEGRRYGQADLELAEEVARRAGLAVDHARLYAETSRARLEAEGANRAKDEFLMTVSHELRTPLNAILGWANLLRRGAVDEATATRALETIERNARAQAHLIGDILDVSRMITGRLRLEARPVKLAKILESAIDVIRPSAEAKAIRLQLVLDPQPELVLGDSTRLQQVAWNLLANAVKFTPEGGRIEIRLAYRDSQACLTVRDSGKGITPEFLPHVFERFRQADSTLSRQHPGLGLGLAIVRHLVELHGGTVHASSGGEGKGATFTVLLPLMTSQDAGRLDYDREREELAGYGHAATPPDNRAALAGLRVLVVDDDADARELLTAMLKAYGVEVTAVASAAAALEAFKRLRPEVLVSDIEMPGEDGYSLIRKVRAENPPGGWLPAIALTAHARAEDRLQALSAGYHVHLPKPVEAAELVAVIAGLVGRRAAG